jgi:hypothetical protein
MFHFTDSLFIWVFKINRKNKGDKQGNVLMPKSLYWYKTAAPILGLHQFSLVQKDPISTLLSNATRTILHNIAHPSAQSESKVK